jgi:hypothetical protein
MKIAGWGLIVALAIPAVTTLAGPAASRQTAQDSQQDSLAAASRRARESKSAQPKPARVWDNDNIPNNPGAVSVVGQDAPEGSGPSDTAAGGASPSPAPGPGSGSAAGKPDVSATSTPAPAPASGSGSSDQSGAAKPAAAGSPSAASGKQSALQADLAAAKDQLQSLTTDLDILRRKFTLDQQVYFGKPDYAADKAGAASVKDEQDQIDAKQQEIADAQKKINDLQSGIESAASSADKPKPAN